MLYIGLIVHYFAYGTPNGEFPSNVARAAVVTEINDPNNIYSDISICVLNPSGTFFNNNIKYNPNTPGCWAYIPQRKI